MDNEQFRLFDDVRDMGIEAEKLGNLAVAIILLERCLQLRPIDGFGWLVLSDAYKAIARYNDCKSALLESFEYAADSDRWVVECRLGMVASKQGQFEEAEHWFNRMCQSHEANCQLWPWIMRASNLIALEQFEPAEQLIRQAIENRLQGDNLMRSIILSGER